MLKGISTSLVLRVLATVISVTVTAPVFAQSTGSKPNILVIWGDDIGWYNPSIYHRGDMGYWTPNIDRIGKEGAMFTCWYGQQSCTAGRTTAMETCCAPANILFVGSNPSQPAPGT